MLWPAARSHSITRHETPMSPRNSIRWVSYAVTTSSWVNHAA